MKLVRLWTGTRFDDLKHVSPSDLSWQGDCWTIKLPKTKTSGPGKKIRVLTAFVSWDAFLQQPWLKVGYDLYHHLAGHVDRDYFLPLPSADGSAVRRVVMKYRDALLMTRALLAELPALGPEGPLLPKDAVGFWSEHGDRAQVVSWAVMCSYDTQTLNFLGRWKVGESSAQYVRTSRPIVLQAQAAIALRIRESFRGVDVVGDSVVLENLGAYLREKRQGGKPSRGDTCQAQVVPGPNGDLPSGTGEGRAGRGSDCKGRDGGRGEGEEGRVADRRALLGLDHG